MFVKLFDSDSQFKKCRKVGLRCFLGRHWESTGFIKSNRAFPTSATFWHSKHRLPIVHTRFERGEQLLPELVCGGHDLRWILDRRIVDVVNNRSKQQHVTCKPHQHHFHCSISNLLSRPRFNPLDLCLELWFTTTWKLVDDSFGLTR